MKNIKFLIISIFTISVVYLFFDTDTINQSNNFDKTVVQTDVDQEKKSTLKKNKTSSIKNKIPRESVNSDLIELLKPPTDVNLDHVWSEEYGCYDESVDACEYDFLNAKSLEEARWMKNNGYPTKSMLNLVNNPSYQDQINELAKSKYPAALTISSIEAMKIGNYREAAHLALSTIAYSDKSKTYPHVLYGEALVLDNKKIAGVTQLFVAGLLGDSLANGRAIGLTPNAAYTATSMDSAHNYIKNIFGLNAPKDQRPMGDGDGDGG